MHALKWPINSARIAQAHETVRKMSPLELVTVLQTEQQYATSLPCFALAGKLGTHILIPVCNQLYGCVAI